MKKKILALCDRETEYVQHMTEYLKTKQDLPFEIYGYTEPEKLVNFGQHTEIEMLVVAEGAYTYEVSRMETGQTLVLSESGHAVSQEVPQIDKYQQADAVYRFIMSKYLEKMPHEQSVDGERAKIIGLYSPVRRCLQTSFALTLGQTMAWRHRTLYISFEHYAGWNGLLKQENGRDLSDLLYYLDEEGEKFRYRMRIVEEKTGALFYIPPVWAGQNLIYITAVQWQRLLERITAEGGYEYVILDLSESLQGIFELLRMCDRVYTIVREDEPAKNKVRQYEQLLRMYEFEDVLDKTRKQNLPIFQGLPAQLERFTKGELYTYVKKVMEEDLEIFDA